MNPPRPTDGRAEPAATGGVRAGAGRADIPPIGSRVLLRQLLGLAAPVLLEQIFHIVVGLTDTYLANNLKSNAAPATSAVGTISYLIWFFGLVVASIGTGSTAIIARAKGARHRRLANSVCGQSVMAALLLGAGLALLLSIGAPVVVGLTGLSPLSQGLALSYLRMLAISLPFLTVMFVANACLRGAGDTLTPAIAMVVVDAVNVVFSFGFTRGWFGLPELGFRGIALGTTIAYVTGGLLQFFVLLSGRGGVRLHLHRLRPQWHTLKRILRIGVPSGIENVIYWAAQFSVVVVINQMDQSSVAAAAHLNAIRIEAFSYLPGFALSIAAATMVGQSLGMRDPARAARTTYLAYALAAGVMASCGLAFIFGGRIAADLMLPTQPHIAQLTARCLFVTGFIQAAFAGAIVFSGALRGAGDTMATMILNLTSAIGVRLAGVLVVVLMFHGGLVAVWVVLSTELFLRGVLNWLRFQQGRWKHLEV